MVNWTIGRRRHLDATLKRRPRKECPGTTAGPSGEGADAAVACPPRRIRPVAGQHERTPYESRNVPEEQGLAVWLRRGRAAVRMRLVKLISGGFRLSPARMYLSLVRTWPVPASYSWTAPGRVAAVNASPSLNAPVEIAVERHQTSVRQLTILVQKQGFKVTHTTLIQVLSGTYKSVPSEATIRAIAWLAGVDASIAFTAAGQHVPGPPFAEGSRPASTTSRPKRRRPPSTCRGSWSI